MLQVMRDEKAETAARLDAAKAAAPYVHPKLAAIDNTHHGPDGGPVRAIYNISDHRMTPDQWEQAFCGEE